MRTGGGLVLASLVSGIARGLARLDDQEQMASWRGSTVGAGTALRVTSDLSGDHVARANLPGRQEELWGDARTAAEYGVDRGALAAAAALCGRGYGTHCGGTGRCRGTAVCSVTTFF